MDMEITKWGNSLGVRIPAVLAKSLGLKAGSAVKLAAVKNQLVIEKAEPEYISLQNMVAAITDDNIHAEIRTGEPVGREVW